MRRDTVRTVFLEDLGYTVMRIQNDDAYNAMEGILRTIREGLEKSNK